MLDIAGTPTVGQTVVASQGYGATDLHAANVTASSVTFQVSDAAELAAAFAAARDGDTIVLADGQYGDLRLDDYTTAVRVETAPGADAVFDAMRITDSANLVLSGLTFDFTFTTDMPLGSALFRVDNSDNLTITNCRFDGDDGHDTGTDLDGSGVGVGLKVLDSANFTFAGNEIEGFWKGLQIGMGSNLAILGNEVSDCRSDAVSLSQITDMLFEGNYLHDRRMAPGTHDHADMIQLMSKGATVASSGLIFRGNLLDIGDGNVSQAMFLNNREVANTGDESMFYRDFVIENNVIIGGQVNGLVVGQIDGLVVRNNTLVHGEPGDGSLSWAPAVNVAAESTNVVIADNVTPQIRGYTGQTDWQVDNNVIIQNTSPWAAGYYGDVFAAAIGQLGGHIEKLQILPDNPIAQAGAGADWLVYDPTPDTLTPIMRIVPQENQAVMVFDASLTAGPAESLQGASYVWTFSDGVVLTGVQVERWFAEAGQVEVTLTVTDATGASASTVNPVTVVGPDMVVLDPLNGMLTAVGSGDALVLGGNEPDTQVAIDLYSSTAALVAAESLEDSTLLDMGALTATINIPFDTLQPILALQDFEIGVTLASHDAGFSAGTLLRLHGSLDVSVTSAGAVTLKLWTDSGNTVSVTTADGTVAAGAWHDVQFDFGTTDGMLRVLVDGQEQDSVLVGESMAIQEGRDMLLGGFNIDSAFDGVLAGLRIGLGSDVMQLADTSQPTVAEVQVTAEPTLDEILDGGLNPAIISGDDGKNTLKARSGSDILIGNDGADTFVLDLRKNTDAGRDIVVDLDFGEGDRLRLMAQDADTFVTPGGDDTTLYVSSSGESVFINSVADLQALIATGQAEAHASTISDGVSVSFDAAPDRMLEIATIGLDDLAAADGMWF